MVGIEHFPKDFIQETSNVRLNTSSCQVYMGLKKGESIPFIGGGVGRALNWTASDQQQATSQARKNFVTAVFGRVTLTN